MTGRELPPLGVLSVTQDIALCTIFLRKFSSVMIFTFFLHSPPYLSEQRWWLRRHYNAILGMTFRRSRDAMRFSWHYDILMTLWWSHGVMTFLWRYDVLMALWWPCLGSQWGCIKGRTLSRLSCLPDKGTIVTVESWCEATTQICIYHVVSVALLLPVFYISGPVMPYI